MGADLVGYLIKGPLELPQDKFEAAVDRGGHLQMSGAKCSQVDRVVVCDMPFWVEIQCEHGWTDKLGMNHCDLGSGCSVGPSSFCVREDCPIYENDDTDNMSSPSWRLATSGVPRN